MTGGGPSLDLLWRTLTFRGGFNTNVVLTGATLLGVAAGVVGVFALLRRRALMADALSHATLPGLAVAFLVAVGLGFSGRSLPVLLFGAAVSGVLGLLCVQALVRHTRLREDAAIGVVLSVFFGAGVVVLSYVQNPANVRVPAAGLNGFIYGQAAAMRPADAALMGGIALVSVLAAAALLKEFAVVCFNDAFARVTGWPVTAIDLLMMALVVLVTVAGLQAVGLILVVSMLIIPPVAARFWTERLWVLVVLSGVFGGVSGYAGSVLSSIMPGLPAGAVIVLTSGVLFIGGMLLAPRRGVAAVALRRGRARLRVASEHMLEAGWLWHTSGVGGPMPWGRAVELGVRRGWPVWLRGLVMLRLLLRGQAVSAGPSAGLALSEAGLEAGARVHRNHRLWEAYLVHYADVAPSHVDWSADQVEHVLSEELVRELERHLADAERAGGAA